VASAVDAVRMAGDSCLIAAAPGLPGRLLLVGAGPREAYDRRAWRQACQAAAAGLARISVRGAYFALGDPLLPTGEATAAARFAGQEAGYRLGRDFAEVVGESAASDTRRLVLGVDASRIEGAASGVRHGRAVAMAVRRARALAELPPNVCTPAYLAATARRIAATSGTVTAQVSGPAALARGGLGCLLAVGRASREAPRLIELTHAPRGPRRRPVVLIGKGITFDSGGLTPKTAGAMEAMKFDMCGAAAVLALVEFAAAVALPRPVVGLVAAAENMPGGNALRPGDVVRSAAGLAIEVLNPDAEGRLVLADALHRARQYGPDVVVDVATLTDSCVTALGSIYSGLFANDDALAERLLTCGVDADDRAWRLPNGREYEELLASDVADLANVGGHAGGLYEGGACTAAAFLGRFARGLRWAHLDVAGSAYRTVPRRRATGRPVPLLAEFLLRTAGEAPAATVRPARQPQRASRRSGRRAPRR
jgi:leucyl aminopeptidase